VEKIVSGFFTFKEDQSKQHKLVFAPSSAVMNSTQQVHPISASNKLKDLFIAERQKHWTTFFTQNFPECFIQVLFFIN
jgi:hypothetical protein